MKNISQVSVWFVKCELAKCYVTLYLDFYIWNIQIQKKDCLILSMLPILGPCLLFFLQRPNLLTDLLAHLCYISKFNFHVTLNLSFISPSKFPLSRNFEGTNPSENHGVIFTRRRFWSNKELSCHLRLRYSTLHFGNSQIFHSSFLGFFSISHY